MTELFKHTLFFKYVRWSIAGDSTWTWFDPMPEQFDRPCEETPAAAADHRDFRRDFRLSFEPDGRSSRLAQEFIRRMTAKGARVLLVTIPKTGHLEELNPSINDELRALAARMSDETGRTQLLVYPGQLSDDSYCDVSHMNEQGAEAYLHWLIPNLATSRNVVAK